MANLKSLIRPLLRYLQRNPDKAQRYMNKTARTLKQRTGGKYNQKIDKATGSASRYLNKQGRGGHGGGSAKYRP